MYLGDVYKYILSIALVLSAGPSAFADDAPAAAAPASGTDSSTSQSCDSQDLKNASVGDCKKLTDGCYTDGSAAEQLIPTGLALAAGQSTNQIGSETTQKNTSSSAADAFQTATNTCTTNAGKCSKTCDKQNAKTCSDILKRFAKCYAAQQANAAANATNLASHIQTQSANPQAAGTNGTNGTSTGSPSGSGTSGTGSSTGSSSGSSGMGSTMQQMLPMMAMLGLAAMTADSGSTAAATATTNPNEALQANGQLDCSKLDGYVYRACDSVLSAKCTTEITANTYLSDSTCLNYSGYYCAYTGAAASTVMIDTSSGLPAIASAGEGYTSTYCAQVKAVNFCQIAGNALCPSCVQLSKIQSTTCQNNAAACLAQSSNAATAVSMQNTCPGGDPAVSTALTAASVTTAPTTAIISPASLKAQSVMAGGMNAMSVTSIPSDVATREGLASSGAAVQTYAGGSNARSLASSSGSYQVASVSSSGNRASVTSSGPATDVQGEYGSNLFNMGSQVYRQRCAAGKLNNCP